MRRNKRSTVSLRNNGIVVAQIAPHTRVRHILNGKVIDESSKHIQECNWNPFAPLESEGFFETQVTQTTGNYTIIVQVPEYISRYIRVQVSDRVLAVVAKAVARRQWCDSGEKRVNVHELWKTYWRLFKIPVQCDLSGIRTLYGESCMTIVVPKHSSWTYRLANWVEQRLWKNKRVSY